MALAIQVGTASSGRTLVAPAPSPWPPKSLSGLTAEEGHSPGSTRLCRGRPGREGRERALCGWAPQAEGQRAGCPGHRQQRSPPAPLTPFTAAKEASSMPHRQPLRLRSALLPRERRCSQPSTRRGKSKATWRRERQRRREGTGEPDPIWLHQWDRSVAAQRQVTISKLGPCSPGLVGGGKGRRSGREQRGCLPRQRRWPPPSPFSQDACPGTSPSNTPLLGNLSVECSPQTSGCWERVGLSPRAWEPEAKILIGGGGGCEGAGFPWGLGARKCLGWSGVGCGGQQCRSSSDFFPLGLWLIHSSVFLPTLSRDILQRPKEPWWSRESLTA